MLRSPRVHRPLDHHGPAVLFHKLCHHPVRRCPVVREFCIRHRKRRADHGLIGIGEGREQPVRRDPVPGHLLIKQQHPVPVEIPDILRELRAARKPAVGIDRGREFVIRIRIIERNLPRAAVRKDPFERRPCERPHAGAPLLIILDALEEPSRVILPAPCKILEPQPVFDRDHESSGVRPSLLPAPQVRQNPHQLGPERIRRVNVVLKVFKNTDEEYVIVIIRKLRLHIGKISHMNGDIVLIPVAVCIDQGALPREIHTVHRAHPWREAFRDRAGTRADLKHLLRAVKRDPADDIAAQLRQMIERRPVPPLLDDLPVGTGFLPPDDLQKLPLHLSVTVIIPAGIFGIVERHLPDLLRLHPVPHAASFTAAIHRPGSSPKSEQAVCTPGRFRNRALHRYNLLPSLLLFRVRHCDM